MEWEWMHDHMETEQVLSARPVQVVVETEAALPGGLREEARIFHTDATVAMQGGEAAGGRVAASGHVTFHVLYSQGNLEQVRVLEAGADFSQSLPLKDDHAQQGAALVRPRGEVQHVSARVLGGRLHLQAVISLSAEALLPRNLSFIRDVSAQGNVERAMQTLSIQRAVGEGEGQALLREEFTLSDVLQIRETLYATGSARVEDILGGADGKVTVTGVIALEAYHTADMPGRPLVYTRHNMPFEQSIYLTGSMGDALAARSEVRDVAVLSQDGREDGEKIMRAEVQLHTEITALQHQQLEALRDVFTTSGDNVETSCQQVIYRTGMIRETAAESGKTVMELPDGAPWVKTALLGFARPVLTGAEKQGGRLVTEGILDSTLIYLTDDNPIPVTARQETPFRMAFTTQAGPEDALSLQALQVEPSPITGDRVEMKYVLQLQGEGVRKDETAMIVDASPVSAPEGEKGISLCFLQKEEGLWDVAKRHRAPLQQVLALNPDWREGSGQPVIICRP